MSFIGKIRNALSRSNRMHVGGFSVGGAKPVDKMPEPPKPTPQQVQQQQQTKKVETYTQQTMQSMGASPTQTGNTGSGGFGSGGNNHNNNSSGGASGGPSPDKQDFLARRFNYERNDTFPWLGSDQLPAGSRPDLRKGPMNREYSEHAIDQSGSRGIPTVVVEHAIAYGVKDSYDGDGHNRVYQGVVVGVTKDEKRVRTVYYSRKLDK